MTLLTFHIDKDGKLLCSHCRKLFTHDDAQAHAKELDGALQPPKPKEVNLQEPAPALEAKTD